MKATFEVVALLSTVHGSWFPAHGLRQDGSGTPDQVLNSKIQSA